MTNLIDSKGIGKPKIRKYAKTIIKLVNGLRRSSAVFEDLAEMGDKAQALKVMIEEAQRTMNNRAKGVNKNTAKA